MLHRNLLLIVAGVVLVLASAGCGGLPKVTSPTVAPAGPARAASPVPSPSPVASPTPFPISGPTFILIRAQDITAGARLNFQGQGFLPGEQTTVTIDNAQGQT